MSEKQEYSEATQNVIQKLERYIREGESIHQMSKLSTLGEPLGSQGGPRSRRTVVPTEPERSRNPNKQSMKIPSQRDEKGDTCWNTKHERMHQRSKTTAHILVGSSTIRTRLTTEAYDGGSSGG